MARVVQTVLLCEDRQHESFARRFLQGSGTKHRVERVEIAPRGRGSGEQFVRERFVRELRELRARSHRVQAALIVLIDADRLTVAERVNQLESAAFEGGLAPRGTNERVAIIVPARNIETWLAFLDGVTVDEVNSYPKLIRERDCQRHVSKLLEICNSESSNLRLPASLATACSEYKSRIHNL